MKVFILFEQNAAWNLEPIWFHGPKLGNIIGGTQNRFEPEIVEMDAECQDKNK